MALSPFMILPLFTSASMSGTLLWLAPFTFAMQILLMLLNHSMLFPALWILYVFLFLPWMFSSWRTCKYASFLSLRSQHNCYLLRNTFSVTSPKVVPSPLFYFHGILFFFSFLVMISVVIIYYLTILYTGIPCFIVTSFCCTLQILHFYKWQVCGNLPSSKSSFTPFFSIAFAHFMSCVTFW